MNVFGENESGELAEWRVEAHHETRRSEGAAAHGGDGQWGHVEFGGQKVVGGPRLAEIQHSDDDALSVDDLQEAVQGRVEVRQLPGNTIIIVVYEY
jgi:hypothetical protein